ncbi:MAG: kelch repeat-containing protein [Terracidiphilus sp.]|jgi:N-acetylneuraminic acid mutarotase
MFAFFPVLRLRVLLVVGLIAVTLLSVRQAAIAQTSAPLQWTWMGGSSTVGGNGGRAGVYGTLGKPAAGNIPGSRENTTNWTDSGGNYWLFGGLGYDTIGTSGALNDLWEFNPSTNEWAWMGGSSTLGCTPGWDLDDPICGQSGVYGTLGTPAAGNFPGGRRGAASWTDSSGRFWLFGGYGLDTSRNMGYLNDLWEFNPSTKEWTWIGGSSTMSCTPGSGGPAVCGQPGVYGTLGTPVAGNVAGSRMDANSWTDSNGNLWLFGGYGYDASGIECDLNDLWEFNPSTKEWVWMGGSSTLGSLFGHPGVYGTLGKPDAGNIPGSRDSASNWIDSSGNFWLFGGDGFDGSGDSGLLNDLWEFNPSTKEWAWMGGSSTMSLLANGTYNPPGVYGTMGTPAAGNVPGGRGGASSWTDSSGNFWLFGGFGGNGFSSEGYLSDFNDLWEFNPSSGEWTWMSGSSTTDQSGVYGTLGTPAAVNIPGGHSYSSSWADSSGRLWFFGGYGWDASGSSGALNDVWEYQPVTGIAPAKITPSVTVTLSSSSITTAQFLTVTVTVSGGAGNPTPTGTVTLTKGGYTSAAATLSGGSATIIVPGASIATGSNTLTAVYAVDSASFSIYNSASAATSVTVTTVPRFTVSATSVLVYGPGGDSTSTITVTPFDGFTGNVVLTAAIKSSPADAVDLPTMSFGSTTPVSITGTAAGTATLTISTTLPTEPSSCFCMMKLIHSKHPGVPWYAAGGTTLACVLFFGIPARRRWWRNMLGMLLLLVILGGGVDACGGSGSSNPGTTPGNYTLTVTGTSGTMTETGTVALTVYAMY